MPRRIQLRFDEVQRGKATNVAADANDRRAAVRDVAVTGLAVAISSAIKLSPYCCVICVVPEFGRPVYLTLVMVD
jgi:hypothetical protein